MHRQRRQDAPSLLKSSHTTVSCDAQFVVLYFGSFSQEQWELNQPNDQTMVQYVVDNSWI